MQGETTKKIESLHEWFSLQKTIDAKKHKAKFEFNNLFLKAAQILKHTKDEIENVRTERNLITSATGTLEMAVTINRNGQIAGAMLLDS